MIDYFQENKRSLWILTGLLLLLAIILFFFLLWPNMKEVTRTEGSIEATEADLELLRAELEKAHILPEEVDVELLKLANMIPHERELDTYLAWLQKLEAAADVFYENISFTYDSNVDTFMGEEDDEGDDRVTTLDEEIEGFEDADADDETDAPPIEEPDESTGDSEEADEEDAEQTIDPTLLKEKPEGLEVLLVRIEGHAKELDDFMEFLQLIEREERISFVSSLEFAQPTKDDISFSDNPRIALSFEAELTTFYYPE